MTIHPSALMLAMTTEADEVRAETLALRLLEDRLVACVSLAPIRSLYLWREAVQKDTEIQLLLKTTSEHLEALHRAVIKFHSYDTPEWLVWPAEASQAYGSWALEVLRTDASRPAPAETPGSAPPAG